MVVLGRLLTAWGVKGQLKVASYTDPPEALLAYAVWYLAKGPDLPGVARQWDEIRVKGGRLQGRGLVAELEGIDNPEYARQFGGRDVAVPRDQLPATGPKEYYWEDLLGLRVRTTQGVVLGRVSHFVDLPGQPAAMVVRDGPAEHWLPLAPKHLKKVDLERGEIEVDWEANQ
jgi:16S rRNA processing protein RimM